MSQALAGRGCQPVGAAAALVPMLEFGVVLYAILVLLVVMFLRRAWGRSFDDVLARSEAEHHQVHGVHSRHPLGGTWMQFRQWMKEEER